MKCLRKCKVQHRKYAHEAYDSPDRRMKCVYLRMMMHVILKSLTVGINVIRIKNIN